MPTIELSRKELALKLYMQGVATSCIAERFGITRPSVNKLISEARKLSELECRKQLETS